MAKQFTSGLCGLLKKSKLSRVSGNCFMLQETSGSLGEAGRILWNYCMLQIWGVVLRYPCVEHVEGGLWRFVSLIVSCDVTSIDPDYISYCKWGVLIDWVIDTGGNIVVMSCGDSLLILQPPNSKSPQLITTKFPPVSITQSIKTLHLQ